MVDKKKSIINIRYYPKEHYLTLFNKKTGFFARIEEAGYKEPFYSKRGPELLDISITNWCDKKCNICYRDSNKNANHIELDNLQLILDQALELGVEQIALGGGNPNNHPDFIKILNLIRIDYGIVPSYTTNGRYLSAEIIHASKEFCGAVAVSSFDINDEGMNAAKKLIKSGVKTNIHFVLTKNSIKQAIRWLEHPSELPNGLNAIIFLSYKPVGKNGNDELSVKNSGKIKTFFSLLTKNNYKFKIGFDSCIISGIVKYTNFDPKFIEPCEAGRFSAFISEDLKMYPCSFMAGFSDGINLKKEKIINAWSNAKIFQNTRRTLSINSCSCDKHETCLGGCPIFSTINFC